MRKRFFVTSSLPYINASPHIGFAQEIVATDAIARFHRQKGEEVLFATGTDEHGTKVEKEAKKAGLSPQEFSEKMAKEYQGLKTLLNISNDDFIRTSEPRHQKKVEEIWGKLRKDIYKKKYSGLYCVGHEAFVKESELVDGKCPDHDLAPEKLEEENYFFALSQYQKPILEHLKKNPDFIAPSSRYREFLSFLEKEGLADISVSRPKEKLSWAFPVPGDPSQVIYVWFDALINYLTVAKDFWPADLHIIGKDILRFHAGIWPGMLLATGLPLPKKIFVHGFISVEGKKMSKSLGNVVAPDDLVKKFGIDETRFILLRGLSFSEDSDFSWGFAQAIYNAELADGLGNLLQRTLTLINQSNIKIEPAPRPRGADADRALEKLDFQGAFRAIWEIVEEGNKLVEKEKPWELISKQVSGNSRKLKEILTTLVRQLETAAAALKPLLPETSEKIFDQLRTGKPEPLFPKIK